MGWKKCAECDRSEKGGKYFQVSYLWIWEKLVNSEQYLELMYWGKRNVQNVIDQNRMGNIFKFHIYGYFCNGNSWNMWKGLICILVATEKVCSQYRWSREVYCPLCHIVKYRVIIYNCHFLNILKLVLNSWNDQNLEIKIILRYRHFDILMI